MNVCRLATILSFVLAVGCKQKPAEKSQVRSLDEVANNRSLPQKECSGLEPVKASFSLVNSASKVLNRALTAVPEEFQDEFNAYGGKIVVDNKVYRDRCQKTGSQVCHDFIYSFSRKKFLKLEIIFPEKPETIIAGIVQSFSYLYTQVLFNFSVVGREVIPRRQEDFARSKMIHVAEGFLADVVEKNGTTANLQKYFSPSQLSWLDSNVDSTGFALQDGPFSKDEIYGFADLIFAELVDSQFCHKGTLETLNQQFRLAMNRSRSILSAMSRNARQDSRTQRQNIGRSKGFSLFGDPAFNSVDVQNFVLDYQANHSYTNPNTQNHSSVMLFNGNGVSTVLPTGQSVANGMQLQGFGGFSLVSTFATGASQGPMVPYFIGD